MIPAVEQQSMQSVLLARQQPGTLAQVMMAQLLLEQVLLARALQLVAEVLALLVPEPTPLAVELRLMPQLRVLSMQRLQQLKAVRLV